jgi:spermidine synthase
VSEIGEVRTIARTVGARGEIALRRRSTEGGSVDELIVNGAFAMDSAETSTEQQLAAVVARAGAAVLVGGLGLGYSVAELLVGPVAHVDVVELEPDLVAWAHEGATKTLATVATDPRVRLEIGDVADVLLGHDRRFAGQRWDGILLDVDNGPDFLIHQENARVYESDLLRAAAARLEPGGTLAIWCQGPAAQLAASLRHLGGRVEGRFVEVVREGRWLEYAIYTLTT